MLKIAHLVNPVDLPPPSDLVVAQPLVFEALRIARETAAEVADVRLLAACYPEDVAIVPAWFRLTPLLERSILDRREFAVKRKLPLIADLIERLITTEPDADLYIYSNVDIIVTPQIYRFIVQRVATGVDALTINRMSVKDHPYRPDELPLIWAEIGEESAGYDFFVFTRAIAERFELGEVVIGISGIGMALHLNLLVHAQRHELWHAHQLTKHVGDQTASGSRGMRAYTEHNKNELDVIRQRLQVTTEFVAAHRPATNLSAAFVARHQARARARRRARRFARLQSWLRRLLRR